MRHLAPYLAASFVLGALACDDVTVIAEPDSLVGTVDSTVAPPPLALPDSPPECDLLDPTFCALPWPSSQYLEADDSRATGYTLAFGEALPRNLDEIPLDAAPYRRMDGYGLGDPLMVRLGDVRIAGLASEWNVAPSLAEDAPIQWFQISADGALTRIPYWIDVDVQETRPRDSVLVVRPGVVLQEATRYVAAFTRRLTTTTGVSLRPGAAFAALRDGRGGEDPRLAGRQARFDAVFGLLEGVGLDRGDLVLAWDFVTASSDALHGPMLHMRDEALSAVGPDGPELVGLEVEELSHSDWAFELRGRFRVPHYMIERPKFIKPMQVVYHFNEGPDGLPEQSGWVEPEFWLRVPKSAVTPGQPGTPHGLVLYGHGQNGRGTQVRGGFNGRIANQNRLIFFACDMWGMAEEDVDGIFDMLGDLSGFPRMADRLHQGVLNHVLLARAMRQRLPTLPQMTSRGVNVDPSELFYSGISQGGIYGTTVVAVSPDITRGHLGVPGSQYGYLLPRSRNFAPFFLVVSGTYPGRANQLVVIQALQQLWNQADPLTYHRKIHTPFAGDPENAVLYAPAKGDVQVAVSSLNALARTPDLKIPVMPNYDARDGRVIDLADEATYPHSGSGIVLYDYGNAWPEESAIRPPTSPGPDPHGKPRQAAHHNRQLVHFLRNGEIIDVCSDDGAPGCTPQ